jgi:RHS repeat-associated protein
LWRFTNNSSDPNQRAFVPFQGRILAEYYGGSTPGTIFDHPDQLGSLSTASDYTGNNFQERLYYPFGESWTGANMANLGMHQTFAELPDYDPETDQYNTPARHYSPMGRWLSPDPVVITTERLKNPQQLNLYAYVANNPLQFVDRTGDFLTVTGDQQADYNDLCQIAGDACNRLKIDEKTGNVAFDTTGLDLSKNEGAALINDLVTSTNTYEFSEGPTVETANGPQKVDFIMNLPAFGDQRQIGLPVAGASDVVALFLNNPNITKISNTNLKVALDYTVAFHELAEAYAKIEGGKGGHYEAGHNAAHQREMTLRDQRPYLKEYNTGAGGPANSPNPQGGIIIKK